MNESNFIRCNLHHILQPAYLRQSSVKSPSVWTWRPWGPGSNPSMVPSIKQRPSDSCRKRTTPWIFPRPDSMATADPRSVTKIVFLRLSPDSPRCIWGIRVHFKSVSGLWFKWAAPQIIRYQVCLRGYSSKTKTTNLTCVASDLALILRCLLAQPCAQCSLSEPEPQHWSGQTPPAPPPYWHQCWQISLLQKKKAALEWIQSV